MESNKDEARRALDLAERKLSKNDYDGAKKYANKAQALYPKLRGLDQMLIMIDVYVFASNTINRGEADWYGILGVDPLVNDEALKKHYKKLALLLHPDKNRFNGAEDAFKLVLQAWDLLSDKAKRSSYDQKRKSNQSRQHKSGMQKPRKPHESTASYWSEFKPYGSEFKHEPKKPEPRKPEPRKPETKKPEPKQPEPKQPEPKQPEPKQPEPKKPEPKQPEPKQPEPKQPEPKQPEPKKPEPKQPEPKQPEPKPKPKPKPEPKPDSPVKTMKYGTFWTVCNSNRCKTYMEFTRGYLNETLACPNCRQDLVATELLPEVNNGRPVIILSPCNQSMSKRTSASNSAKTNAAPRRTIRWFEPKPEPDSSPNKEKASIFWTLCNNCKTLFKCLRASSLSKTLACPYCSEEFLAAEIIPGIINGRPAIILTPPTGRSRCKNTSSDASSSTASASGSAKTAYQKEEILRRWFPESREKIAADFAAAAAGGNADEAKRLYKKMTTGNRNSASKAESLFEEPMTSGNANSTLEAERLFKEHMTDVK